MNVKLIGLLVAGTIAVAACSPEAESPAPAATPAPAPAAPAAAAADTARPASAGTIPDRIVIERGGFIPEGIEYDQANDRFLTGSLAEGSVFEIDNDGSMETFVRDADLVSSVGIEVDEPRDRLLVTNSDRAVFGGQSQGQAKLGVYSLTTGERIAMVDLGATNPGDGAFFANDVAVADDGTIYVTDTQRNVVYAVDNDYQASVFHAFEAAEGMALNGLVYHPEGYLIVVDMGAGNLYKLPTADASSLTQVRLAEPLQGSDGLVWAADGRLASVSNSTSSVVALSSVDDWASAQVAGVATFEGQATTGAAVGDEIYVVQPHFNDADPPVILRAEF